MAPSLKGKSAQTVQTGIELIGSSSKMADLEVISAAIEVLSACSEKGFSLEIGDIGFFRELVSKLSIDEDQSETIRKLIEAKNYPALNDFLDKIGNNDITHALKKLPRLFGGEEVFEKAAKLFSDEKIDRILASLKSLYKQISKIAGNGRITVDLGMVNRTDYYTGVIIKGYLEGYGEEVLSGGRYDKLISEFGYDVPATGFAVNIDAVSQIILKNSQTQLKSSDVLLFAEEGYEMEALAYAGKLRSEGFVTEHSFDKNIDDAIKYAEAKNINRIVRVGSEITEVR